MTNSKGSDDPIQIFNSTVNLYKTRPSEKSLSSVKNSLKKLVPSKFHSEDNEPQTMLFLFNVKELISQLELSSPLLWDLISFLNQACENPKICQLSSRKIQFLPSLAKLLHAALSSAQSTKVQSLLSMIRVLVVEMEISRRESYLLTLLSDLSSLLTDTGVMNVTSGSEFTGIVLFILCHLCRGSYLVTKQLVSIMSLHQLTSLTFISCMDQLYAECLCFYMRRVNLAKSVPEEVRVRDYLPRMANLFVSSVSVDDLHTMKLIHLFLKDLQQDAEYRSLISSQDCTEHLKQIILALDLNEEFNPSTSELLFSFLVEIVKGFQTDHIALFDAIIKFAHARLESKPLTKLVPTFDLINVFVNSIDFNSSNLSSAEEKNLKFQVDQLLPSINIIASGKNKNEDFIETFVACLRSLQVIATVPGWSESVNATIKTVKIQQVYNGLVEGNRKEQSVLTTEFLSLCLQLGESGNWLKIGQEMAGNRERVNMVAEVLKRDNIPGDVMRKALNILAKIDSPELYFLGKAEDEELSSSAPALPEPLADDKEVNSLVSRLSGELSRLEVEPVFSSVLNVMGQRQSSLGLEVECMRQALQAADSRASSLALVTSQQESHIRNLEQLVRDLSASLLLAREELSDIRAQHGEVSKEADTTRDRLGKELETVREELAKEREMREQGDQKYNKQKEALAQLKEDLALYKQNEQQLEQGLKREMKAKEEISATLGKKLKKKEQQLEEEITQREKSEKDGEELKKQVSTMDQLNKRQDHLLSKKEKELAKVKEELANMQKIHDQIFNLSTKARGSAAC